MITLSQQLRSEQDLRRWAQDQTVANNLLHRSSNGLHSDKELLRTINYPTLIGVYNSRPNGQRLCRHTRVINVLNQQLKRRQSGGVADHVCGIRTQHTHTHTQTVSGALRIVHTSTHTDSRGRCGSHTHKHTQTVGALRFTHTTDSRGVADHTYGKDSRRGVADNLITGLKTTNKALQVKSPPTSHRVFSHTHCRLDTHLLHTSLIGYRNQTVGHRASRLKWSTRSPVAYRRFPA